MTDWISFINKTFNDADHVASRFNNSDIKKQYSEKIAAYVDGVINGKIPLLHDNTGVSISKNYEIPTTNNYFKIPKFNVTTVNKNRRYFYFKVTVSDKGLPSRYDGIFFEIQIDKVVHRFKMSRTDMVEMKINGYRSFSVPTNNTYKMIDNRWKKFIISEETIA